MPSLCFENYALLESIPNKSARPVSASSGRFVSCSHGPGLSNQGPILAFAKSAFAEDPGDPRGFSPMADFIRFP